MARDRYEDDEYPDGRDDDRPRRRRPAAGGTGALLGPGIGLILVGLISLALGVVTLVSGDAAGERAELAARRQQEMDKIDRGPDPDDVKRQKREMMNNMMDVVEKAIPALPLFRGLVAVGGAVVLLGGVQLVRGRGRGLGMVSAVVAMIPCFTCFACVLGIPVGVWALVVLGRPEVKAALAARPADARGDDFDRV